MAYALLANFKNSQKSQIIEMSFENFYFKKPSLIVISFSVQQIWTHYTNLSAETDVIGSQSLLAYY